MPNEVIHLYLCRGRGAIERIEITHSPSDKQADTELLHGEGDEFTNSCPKVTQVNCG